ncbi:MAG: hypothetical protein AB7U35_09625 [Sphingobium sp.]
MTHAEKHRAISVPTTSGRRRLRARDWPRPPRKDPLTRLTAQILRHAGPDSSVLTTSTRPWASATFVGARHRIVLKLEGEVQEQRAEELAALLPDAEFSISGHIVADLCVDNIRTNEEAEGMQDDACHTSSVTYLELTVLTIEDW